MAEAGFNDLLEACGVWLPSVEPIAAPDDLDPDSDDLRLVRVKFGDEL